MPQGEVGGGHQNPYNPIGEINIGGGKPLQYRKGNRLMGITRDKPPCWNAGTPVEWDDNPNGIGVANANGGNNANQVVDADGIIDGKKMTALTRNVSEDGESIPVLAAMKIGEDFIEYHPLIQFYNEVMARLVKDRMTRDLDNLRGPTSARRLWQYLERKYLNRAEEESDKEEPDKKEPDKPDSFTDFLRKLHDGQDEDKLPKYKDEDLEPAEDAYGKSIF